MNHRRHTSRPADPAGPEVGLVREVFTDVANDVTPSAVPLAAIEREGRRRRRRRSTVLGAACGVLLVPLAVVVLRGGEGGGSGAGTAEKGTRVSSSPTQTRDASPSPSVPPGKVRVVTPGERVRVAPGTRIWLTRDGKHWTEPGAPEPQFRSVSDGNLDISVPGVSLQESSEGGTHFLSGIYYGGADAARVRIETRAGEVNGTVLTLAGKQKWGVWYASVKERDTPSSTSSSSAPSTTGFTERVTVYDSAGVVIASQDFSL
ncbi:hypothetical protein [Streptomyces sp. SAS_270]|uniref:hypothetical protein n=1 Tax=Streptomyces sp. SAS_270 TaxID=3412748 RepID=UPI00403D4E65